MPALSADRDIVYRAGPARGTGRQQHVIPSGAKARAGVRGIRPEIRRAKLMEGSAPSGAVFIAPKADKPKKIEKWPRFVWCAHPHREGIACGRIWHEQRSTTGVWIKGRLEVRPTLIEYEITSEEATFGIAILMRNYPPPAPYKAAR